MWILEPCMFCSIFSRWRTPPDNIKSEKWQIWLKKLTETSFSWCDTCFSVMNLTNKHIFQKCETFSFCLHLHIYFSPLWQTSVWSWAEIFLLTRCKLHFRYLTLEVESNNYQREMFRFWRGKEETSFTADVFVSARWRRGNTDDFRPLWSAAPIRENLVYHFKKPTQINIDFPLISPGRKQTSGVPSCLRSTELFESQPPFFFASDFSKGRRGLTGVSQIFLTENPPSHTWNVCHLTRAYINLYSERVRTPKRQQP